MKKITDQDIAFADRISVEESKMMHEAEVYKTLARSYMIVESAMWISAATAVAISVYYTKSEWCLLALFTPVFGGSNLSFGKRKEAD